MNALYKLVLKGSLMSAFALVTAAVGCSDANKDDETGAGGEAGKAGSSNVSGSTSNPGGAGGDAPTTTAGTAGTGGGEGGAGPTTEGGAAGAGGAPPTERPDIVFSVGGDGSGGEGGAASDPTVAKFCNSLTFGTDDDPMDTTMILEIGEGAEKVTFTAFSGTCAPADGAECKAIPHGTAVPVALFDADAPAVALDEGTIKSRGGANWVFWTDLTDEAQPSPIVQGAPFESPACEDIIFEDVF